VLCADVEVCVEADEDASALAYHGFSLGSPESRYIVNCRSSRSFLALSSASCSGFFRVVVRAS
jgi:hypothetical protein